MVQVWNPHLFRAGEYSGNEWWWVRGCSRQNGHGAGQPATVFAISFRDSSSNSQTTAGRRISIRVGEAQDGEGDQTTFVRVNKQRYRELKDHRTGEPNALCRVARPLGPL